jgi:uncharacterized membrane protein YfcA
MIDTFWIVILTLVSSVIGTISGFGISTIMVPVMLFFFPPPITLLFVAIIHWFGDLWKIFLFKHGFNWKVILGFGIPGTIASYIGARITLNFSQETLALLVGIFLISYVIFVTLDPKFRLKQTLFAAGMGGVLSGFTGGLTGVAGGAIRAAILTAFDFKKEIFVFTTGILGMSLDFARIFGYIMGGSRLPTELISGIPFFIAATFVGAEIGKKIINKIPQKKFRMMVSVFLLLIGVRLIFF